MDISEREIIDTAHIISIKTTAEKVEFKIGRAETMNSQSLCIPWDIEREGEGGRERERERERGR